MHFFCAMLFVGYMCVEKGEAFKDPQIVLVFFFGWLWVLWLYEAHGEGFQKPSNLHFLCVKTFVIIYVEKERFSRPLSCVLVLLWYLALMKKKLETFKTFKLHYFCVMSFVVICVTKDLNFQGLQIAFLCYEVCYYAINVPF